MKKNLLLRFLTGIFLAPLVLISIYFGGVYFNFLLFVISIVGFYEIYKINNKKIFLIVLILFLLFLIFSYQIRNFENGKHLIFLILLITWLSDTGGYVFGKIFGGKKINFISPNKTYIGFLGSITFSFLSLPYIYTNNIKIFNSMVFNIILIFFSSLLVIFGDLFFSFLKRKIKIKDFSNIIPGHGGLFDRIDGMIILIIFYYLFVVNL